MNWVPHYDAEVDFLDYPDRGADCVGRALLTAGILGGSKNKIFLEQFMTDAMDGASQQTAYLCVSLCGTPETSAGRAVEKMMLNSPGSDVEFDRKEIIAALLYAIRGDGNNYDLVASAIKGHWKRLAPVMGYFVRQKHSYSADTDIMKGIGRLETIDDPLLQDLDNLVHNRICSIEDFNFPERFIYNNFKGIRKRFASLLAIGIANNEISQSYLLLLLDDDDPEVANVALQSLYDIMPGSEAVKNMILEKSYSEYWMIPRKAVEKMPETQDLFFLDRLTGMWQEDDDSDVQDIILAAFKHLKLKQPEIKRMFYAAIPHMVNSLFGIELEYDSDGDQKSEGLRLLLEVLNTRRDQDAATEKKGKKLIICRSQSIAHGESRPIFQMIYLKPLRCIFQ